MWRIPIMILVLSSALATHVQADSAETASAAGSSALHRTTGVVGKAGLSAGARLRAMQLQLGGTLAVVQPSLRSRLAWLHVPDQWRIGRVPGAGGESGATLAGYDGRPDDSALSYSVSDTVSLGLRYRFLDGEDLAELQVAEAGSLKSGYINHRFLVRARWEF